MESFVKEIQIRWSDFDPNFHVRHTSYYDWATLCRIEFLEKEGLTIPMILEKKMGPILLREECVFRKEILHGDQIFVGLNMIKSKKDYSRWTIEHPIKKQDGTLAAVVTVDGAFIDHVQRKLVVPFGTVAETFAKMPQGPNFVWID